jgi:hypothetical protein
MGETSNVSLMANKISSEIFNAFGWKQEPLRDEQIECLKPDDHKTKTHPSDVVFWYEDPYRECRVYVNTDLKSYSRESIKPHQIRKALRSLGVTVDCANNSKQYRDKYVHTKDFFDVVGLLFLFNHDGGFDENFDDTISSINPASLLVPTGRQIYLLGPDRIGALASVASDILRLRGAKTIPAADHCHFYYPNTVLERTRQINAQSASLETILGPWIPFCYDTTISGIPAINHILYYFGEGSSAEEFKYIIDYLFRSQSHSDYNNIVIKTTKADKRAPVFLNKAKEQYATDFFGLTEFIQRLERITIESVTRTVPGYNDVEIGMRDS